MAQRKLTPALQYSQGRSAPWSGAELVNMFSEMSEGDKADLYAIMSIPGLDLFSDISTLGVRGVHVMQGILYAVVGTTLYSINSAGVETSLGTVAGSEPVMMADNGAQLGIQSANTGYVLDGGVLYTGIVNLPSVSNLVYIDGYFVWSIADSDQFIISGINDGLSYDPLDVATVEGDPDNIIGCVNDHRELQFYGGRTVEIWYNSGAADFPFARQGNAFIERGCADRDSIVKIDNSVHFVGEDKVIYRLNGYEPQRISTHAIEFQISTASYYRGFVYTQLGHKFYILNTDVGTFGYDMATGAWHKRQSYGLDRYRVGCSIPAYGKIIAGDAFTGKLYEFNIDTNTEDGGPIVCEIQLPSIQTDRARATLYSIEAQIQAGVGTVTEPDPQIILSYSRDGGNTYSAGMARAMGDVGEYLTRCIWRLGVNFRQLQIKLVLSSPVSRFVIAWFGDIR
jgi:Phage stabilisation protein